VCVYVRVCVFVCACVCVYRGELRAQQRAAGVRGCARWGEGGAGAALGAGLRMLSASAQRQHLCSWFSALS